MCETETINGVMRDGGYAEYIDLRTEAVVKLDKEIDPAEYAPLLCAGVTVVSPTQPEIEMTTGLECVSDQLPRPFSSPDPLTWSSSALI